MDDRSRRRAGAQGVELRASGSQQPSETMSRSETSEEESDEVMSMMASTDVYRKEDKVRVFGAVRPQKLREPRSCVWEPPSLVTRVAS